MRKIIVHYIIFFIVLHNNNHLYLYLGVNLYFCFIRSSDKSILHFKKSYNCCNFVQIQFTVSYHFDLKWNFSKYHYSITSISNYKLFEKKKKKNYYYFNEKNVIYDDNFKYIVINKCLVII